MTNRRRKLYEALDALSDACGLDWSESATEDLFSILSEAFREQNVAELDAIRESSHNEGLMCDMRVQMVRKIEETVSAFISRQTHSLENN